MLSYPLPTLRAGVSQTVESALGKLLDGLPLDLMDAAANIQNHGVSRTSVCGSAEMPVINVNNLSLSLSWLRVVAAITLKLFCSCKNIIVSLGEWSWSPGPMSISAPRTIAHCGHWPETGADLMSLMSKFHDGDQDEHQLLHVKL